MLVLNGFEFCEKIVEIDRTRHVIFITAPEQFYEKMREKILTSCEHFEESVTREKHSTDEIKNDED